jgi:hypothetical protein
MRTAVRAVKSLNKVGGLFCVVQIYQERSGVVGAFAPAIYFIKVAITGPLSALQTMMASAFSRSATVNVRSAICQ